MSASEPRESPRGLQHEKLELRRRTFFVDPDPPAVRPRNNELVLDLPPHLVRDLLEQPLVASLGTFNVDGSIHLVAVWFLWDGSGVLVGTSGASRKARNVVRDPRATIMIHDSPGGMDVRGVTLAGRAELLRGDEALARNDAIHEKYVDRTALTLPNIREFLAFDDITIRLTPERTSFWDETGTPAAAELRASGSYVRTGLSRDAPA